MLAIRSLTPHTMGIYLSLTKIRFLNALLSSGLGEEAMRSFTGIEFGLSAALLLVGALAVLQVMNLI